MGGDTFSVLELNCSKREMRNYRVCKETDFSEDIWLARYSFCVATVSKGGLGQKYLESTLFSTNAIISAVRTYATHQVMKYPVQFSFGSFFSALSHRPPHSSCRLLMIHCLVKMKNWFWSECGFALIGSLPTTCS